MTLNAYRAALQWHIDLGIDEPLADTPVDHSKEKLPETNLADNLPDASIPDINRNGKISSSSNNSKTKEQVQPPENSGNMRAQQTFITGSPDAIVEAQTLSNSCTTLDELKNAIQDFDGLSLKKTAKNMVFADGNPKAKIMVIGEAPGADEDRTGQPFVGVSGQLLDRMFACIGLNRTEETPDKSLYISNIINWRPPGNRTPTESEIQISLPFIKKHIELIEPDLIIMMGGVAAKSLLNIKSSISKMRGSWHDYNGIPCLVTYHPSYLLRTPAQKKSAWQDMLLIQTKING